MHREHIRAMDFLIFIPIGIQAITFILAFEQSLVLTLVSLLQFGLMVVYYIYLSNIRNRFELTITQEDQFFDRQFEEIKQQLGNKSLHISHFLNQKNSIDTIRHLFSHTRMIYSKRIKVDEKTSLSVDLLLLTEAGIYVIHFMDARFIINGHFQDDLIQVQYSGNQYIHMVNPLSDIYPLNQYLINALNVEPSAIKRVLVIHNDSYVKGMESLNDYQEIVKMDDVSSKMKEFVLSSDTVFSNDQVNQLYKILENQIID